LGANLRRKPKEQVIRARRLPDELKVPIPFKRRLTRLVLNDDCQGMAAPCQLTRDFEYMHSAAVSAGQRFLERDIQNVHESSPDFSTSKK
jgi:hypothetical protein